MPERNDKWVVITNWRDLEHPESGGAELVCDEMAKQLAAAGSRVILLSAAVAGRPRYENTGEYTIRRAGGRFTVYMWALLWLLTHRRNVASVVDSQNGIPFFTPLAVRRSTPVILLLHHIHQDQFAAYFPAPVAAVGRWLESRGCRAVYRDRAIIAVSPSTRQGARRALKLRGDIKVVPPGWRLSAGATEAPLVRSEHPTLVTVGRLVPHKRTHLIVRAMQEVHAAIPTARLQIIGSGTELPALQALVAEFKLAEVVTFHPKCSNADRDRLVSTSWLALTASAGEGWGISVIEANALGTPVMSFDRPGLRDSIRHGATGWLVPEGDSLASAMVSAVRQLHEAEFHAHISRQARSWAANFTWDEMGRKLIGVLKVEQRRLHLPHPERRLRTDLATLITIPREQLPAEWAPELRTTDAVHEAEEALTLFLTGTDTTSSSTILTRTGVDETGPGNGIAVHVARTADHLVPFSSVQPSGHAVRRRGRQ